MSGLATIAIFATIPQNTYTVPNIYYCQATGCGPGILRAVLSTEQSRCLLSKRSAKYAGQQLPAAAHNQIVDFAVLRVFDKELGDQWESGFYRFDADLSMIEESLQACTITLSGPK
ncbi:MAG: hypothetical protein WBQ89_11165 [Candidatus Acidiferrum sp.]